MALRERWRLIGGGGGLREGKGGQGKGSVLIGVPELVGGFRQQYLERARLFTIGERERERWRCGQDYADSSHNTGVVCAAKTGNTGGAADHSYCI